MRDIIIYIIVAIFVVLIISLAIWWEFAQYGNCMEKFSDWFYCIQHAFG